MQHKLRWFCLVALFATFIPEQSLFACGKESAVKNSTEASDLSWVKSSTPIYGLDDLGLYEARLNSSNIKRLTKAIATHKKVLAISPDGRNIFYRVSDNEYSGKDSKYYLFDILIKKTREIHGLPKDTGLGQLRFVGFSPDSKFIAWQDNGAFEDFQKNQSLPEMLIFSTATLKPKKLHFPTKFWSAGNAVNCFKSQWSPDSTSIYSNFMNTQHVCSLPQEDEHKLVYFKMNVVSGASTRVDGRYEFNDDKQFFRNFYIENGKEIQLSYPCAGDRNCSLKYGDHYISGDSHAYFEGSVEGEQNLFIKRGLDKPLKIETGHSSFCSGSNIGIVSWLDNGKYLIYAYEGKNYLYGVEERRKSLLPQLTGTYNWLPNDSSQLTYPSGSSQKDSDSPRYYNPSDMWD